MIRFLFLLTFISYYSINTYAQKEKDVRIGAWRGAPITFYYNNVCVDDLKSKKIKETCIVFFETDSLFRSVDATQDTTFIYKRLGSFGGGIVFYFSKQYVQKVIVKTFLIRASKSDKPMLLKINNEPMREVEPDYILNELQNKIEKVTAINPFIVTNPNTQETATFQLYLVSTK